MDHTTFFVDARTPQDEVKILFSALSWLYFVIFPINSTNQRGEDLPIFVAQIINLLYNINHLDTLQINILRQKILLVITGKEAT